jgi:hypothetical protein
MTMFILLLFLASVWIWGVKAIFSEGYIFHNAGVFIEANFAQWLYKPLIGCTVCMSSIHGTLWYWIVMRLFLPDLTIIFTFVGWIVFCICLCGINFILVESIYKEDNG